MSVCCLKSVPDNKQRLKMVADKNIEEPGVSFPVFPPN